MKEGEKGGGDMRGEMGGGRLIRAEEDRGLQVIAKSAVFTLPHYTTSNRYEYIFRIILV